MTSGFLEVRDKIGEPFWFGASLAFPLAILSVPAVAYAGMALANSFWKLHHGGNDAPGIVELGFGLLHGIVFGIAFSVAIGGIIIDVLWRIFSRYESTRSLISRAAPVSFMKLWLVSEVLYCLSCAWVFALKTGV